MHPRVPWIAALLLVILWSGAWAVQEQVCGAKLPSRTVGEETVPERCVSRMTVWPYLSLAAGAAGFLRVLVHPADEWERPSRRRAQRAFLWAGISTLTVLAGLSVAAPWALLGVATILLLPALRPSTSPPWAAGTACLILAVAAARYGLWEPTAGAEAPFVLGLGAVVALVAVLTWRSAPSLMAMFAAAAIAAATFLGRSTLGWTDALAAGPIVLLLLAFLRGVAAPRTS